MCVCVWWWCAEIEGEGEGEREQRQTRRQNNYIDQQRGRERTAFGKGRERRLVPEHFDKICGLTGRPSVDLSECEEKSRRKDVGKQTNTYHHQRRFPFLLNHFFSSCSSLLFPICRLNPLENLLSSPSSSFLWQIIHWFPQSIVPIFSLLSSINASHSFRFSSPSSIAMSYHQTMSSVREFWFKWRSSRVLILFIVFVALFLDNMLLTTIGQWGRNASSNRIDVSPLRFSSDHSRLSVSFAKSNQRIRRDVSISSEELFQQWISSAAQLFRSSSARISASSAHDLQLDDRVGDATSRAGESRANGPSRKCELSSSLQQRTGYKQRNDDGNELWNIRKQKRLESFLLSGQFNAEDSF